MTRLTIGIDLGTSAVKVLALSGDGEVVAKTCISYPTHRPRPDWVEQSPEDWWNAVCKACQEIVAQTTGHTIVGIGLCGQLNGFVLLDRDEKLLQNAIIWLDQRAGVETKEIAEHFSDEFLKITANPPASIAVLSKLKWMARHRADLIARTHRIMFVKDYIFWCLTGVWATEATDGSASNMMEFDSRTWSDALLRFCGIATDILPPIVPSGDIAGHVTQTASNQTHFEAGLPAIPGAGDVGSLAVGCGVYEEGILAITLGTAGHVVLSSRAAPLSDDRGIWRLSHVTDDREIWLGLILSGGLSLVWLRNILTATVPEKLDFDGLIALSDGVPPGARGLTFLPFLEGAATPWSNPDARAVFSGLSSSHGAGDLVQAVMEGVAYNIRDCVEAFQDLGGKIVRLRIAEGGSRSAKWCQIIADILQKPVELVKQDDTSASGAAILAMCATTKDLNLADAIDSMVQIKEVYYPDPELRETMDGLYQTYKKLAGLALV